MRNISIIMGFVLLGAFGGYLCRGYYRDTIETTLERETKLQLAELGVKNVAVKVDHMFVDLQFDPMIGLEEKQRIASAVDHGVDSISKVEGVYVSTPAPAPETSSVGLTIGADDKITLTGVVGSESAKQAIVTVVEQINDEVAIDNQISIGKNIESLKWLESSKPFLNTLLTTPGVKSFHAENGEFRLSGVVEGPETVASIGEQALAKLSGFGVVTNEIEVESKTPATLRLAPGKNGYLISGALPDDQKFKAELLRSLRASLGEIAVVEQIALQSEIGKPWWQTGLTDLLPAFLTATNNKGTIEYSDADCVVSGVVSDEGIRNELNELIQTGRPTGFGFRSQLQLKPVIRPELYALRDQEGTIILNGILKQSTAKDELVAKLKEMYTAGRVVCEQVNTASEVGEPEWSGVEDLITSLFSQVKKSSMSLTGDRVTLTGTALSQQVHNELTQLASRVVGEDGTVNNEIIVSAASVAVPVTAVKVDAEIEPSGSKDEVQINQVFKDEVVYFRSGSTSLNGADLEKIKNIVSALKQFDQSRMLVVGGYADQTGDESTNRRLSLNRANAVRQQLIKMGIPTDRMVIKHFGEEKSEKQNDPKSRRVELSLRK